MEDNEKFYDEAIAPKLMEVCELCKAKKIPFLAVVEYAPGEIGSTSMQHPDECLNMVMIRHCTKTTPNIDAYILGLARYAVEKGIDTRSSLIMQLLKKSS